MQIEVSRDVFKLAQVFTISRGSRTEAKVLTVKVSDGTHQGWGECVPYARYNETLESVEAEIAALPAEITRQSLMELLPAGAARNAGGCAVGGLGAKRAGKRAWDLAGLSAPRPEIPAYNLSLGTPHALEAPAAANSHTPLLENKLGTPDEMPRLSAG
ncbi:MAG: dipeptide epimerase, partial [Ruegeria sp.]